MKKKPETKAERAERLVRQGKYLGTLRHLPKGRQAEVRKLTATHKDGNRAGLALAQKIAREIEAKERGKTKAKARAKATPAKRPRLAERVAKRFGIPSPAKVAAKRPARAKALVTSAPAVLPPDPAPIAEAVAE